MDLALTPEQQRLADLTEELARTRFAPRAARYDQEVAFPREDFADLRRHGLLAATAPKSYGGLGLGFNDGDIFGLWLAIKNIAKGDLSLGRCYEGHVNGVTVLANSGTEEQRRRYLPRVVEDGETFVFWGSEPSNPDDPRLVLGGTVARPVEGGYLINGRKQFSTSGGGATYTILFAVIPGHKSIFDSLLMPIIRVDGPGVTVEPEWWQPLGMRATVSHMVQLENVFVPEADVIGGPGAYFKERWQAKFIPAFAASFLGAAEAAMEFALPYIGKRGKEKDPYILHHVANARLAIETMTLWLRHAAPFRLRDPFREQSPLSSSTRRDAQVVHRPRRIRAAFVVMRQLIDVIIDALDEVSALTVSPLHRWRTDRSCSAADLLITNCPRNAMARTIQQHHHQIENFSMMVGAP